MGDPGEIGLTLLLVADLELITGEAGRAQKALERLFRRVGARALALLDGVAAGRGQPLDRKGKAARRVKRPGGGIGETGFDEAVGDHALQVVGGLRLHAGGNFLGKQFDQQVGHQ